MKKKSFVALLMCIVAAFCLVGATACGDSESGRKTLTGSYHIETPINGVKRGADITVMLNADNSIYSIAVEESDEYTTSVGGPWGIFCNLNFLPSLMSVSVEEINGYKITCDENGLPTAIGGMPQEWIVVANTDACGMVILALQDAFKKL